MLLSRKPLWLMICWALMLWVRPAWSTEQVTVYAAASLTNAINHLKQQYELTHAVQIKTSFAGSATLAKQIAAGAPADVFISADQAWIAYLQQRQLLRSQPRVLVTNRLVLIAPKHQAAAIRLQRGQPDPSLLTGRLCTGQPAIVPVGRYARQALQTLGWWGVFEKSLVATDDVRAALAFVERGECRFGIVYHTDALISRRVSVVATFPTDLHEPIVYPAALIKNSNQASQAFFQYLQTAEAQQIFVQYGFQPVVAVR